ncbi:MAG: hypothetical protein ABWY20_19655 [Mycobacterium sp.]
MAEVGRQLIGEQADERHVELACAHQLGHVPAPGVADGDLDGGVAVVERGEGLGPTDRGIVSAAPIAGATGARAALSLDGKSIDGAGDSTPAGV